MKAPDYIRMPDLVMTERTVRMSYSERAVYCAMRDEMIVDQITAANAAVLAGKLSQLANGGLYDDAGLYHEYHTRKLDALEDLIEAANGKPVLVAYWFKSDRQRIEARVKCSGLDSKSDMERWNSGALPVALIHPASAGHGLNLQVGGSTLIWFGLTWSLELYQQTNARIYRQGQQQTVVIHHLLTESTIDIQIMAALKRKDATQSALIDAVKAEVLHECTDERKETDRS
jgi:hypothetical protein